MYGTKTINRCHKDMTQYRKEVNFLILAVYSPKRDGNTLYSCISKEASKT